mmetsp:Transcript_30301/g.39116  ORF Transcript_30301/g.39116 Transcript_30301/m.39116 type:complete len:181 (-) Transcript_30301:158-700(-)
MQGSKSNNEDDAHGKNSFQAIFADLLKSLFPTDRLPQIENSYIVSADLLLLVALVLSQDLSDITADPGFAGWSAPIQADYEHLIETACDASLLCLCWIVGCLANNAYTMNATFVPRNAFWASINSWVTFSSCFVLQAIALNLLNQSSIGVSDVASVIGPVLLTMMIWRIVFAFRMNNFRL